MTIFSRNSYFGSIMITYIYSFWIFRVESSAYDFTCDSVDKLQFTNTLRKSKIYYYITVCICAIHFLSVRSLRTQCRILRFLRRQNNHYWSGGCGISQRHRIGRNYTGQHHD